MFKSINVLDNKNCQHTNSIKKPARNQISSTNFKVLESKDIVTFKGNQSGFAKLESIARKLSANSGDKLDTRGGFVQLTPQQAIATDLLTAINAIKEIATEKGKNINGPIASPIENEKDSSWMKNTTMYNLSPRAVGGLINSIKLLPTIRPESIYLAPIFENCNGALYAQSSLKLDPDIYKDDLKVLNAGLPANQQISADELMKAFVDAAHLLDKKVGMDLIPHVGDWSDLLIEKPQLFRWVKLNEKKDNLTIGLGVNLTDPNDKGLHLNGGKTLQDEFKTALLQAIQDSSITSKDKLLKDVKNLSGSEIFKTIKNQYPDHKDEIKNNVLAEIKQHKGFVNVPVTPWNGTHLPEYKEWVKDGNYPKFQSNDKEPYGNLTAFKFFNHKDTMKGEIDPSSPNQEAIDFFVNIFPQTREKYGLDFLRADMAKHSVDANNGDNTDGSAFRAGYATKEIWKQVIDRARDNSQSGGHQAVGAVAEAFSENMLPFAEMGFDLTIGNDQYWQPKPVDKRGSNSSYNLQDLTKQHWQENIQDRLEDVVTRVAKIADMGGKAISQMFTLDTHDCAVGGNKHRADKEDGNEGITVASTLGMFSSSGKGRRPFYLMNGNEDGSVYLNNKGQDLTVVRGTMPLKNNTTVNRQYHKLFNAYDAVKDILTHKDAQLPQWHNTPRGISMFSVKSPAGDMLTIVNENCHNNASESVIIPDSLTGAEKGLVILDDKNVDIKAGETTKFARVIGKRTFVNIPPAGSHIFKVIKPETEAEWIETAAKEVTRYQKDTINGQILVQALKGDYSFKPSDKSNDKQAAAILESGSKKYELIMPLDDPDATKLQLKEI